MAKKNQKFELDDYGFPADLDVPDFNFKAPQVKDDRNPATKIAKSFAAGAKDSVMNPQFIRQVIREAMPRGYGAALRMADDTSASLRSLYNTSAREIKPMLNDLKRTTARAMPSIEKKLPRSVAERIKKWTQPERGYKSLSVDAQRESAIAFQLGDIFKYQAEENVRKEKESFVNDKLKEGIDQSRHKDTLAQLDAIRVGISKVANYQSNIDTGYQRRSLELQYRHYFVAIDTLEEARRQNAVTTLAMESIVKNTGLPDFVKLRGSERFKEMMRNKFLDSVNDGVFGKRRNFVRNLASSATNTVKERLMRFGGQVREGTDMANMAMDQRDMMEGMGGMMPQSSMAEKLGGIAGRFAGDIGGMNFAKRMGARLGKNRKVMKGANKTAQFAENFPQMANEWSRSETERGGILGWLQNFGKDVVGGSIGGIDKTLNVDRMGNMQEQSLYTRQANKSITEIIPGFLARIHQELRIMRTGDAKTELLAYDYTANKFNGKAASDKAAFDSVFGGWSKDSTKSQLDSMIDKIDPKKTLDAKGREALGQQLLRDNMNNRSGGKDRLTQARSWSANGDQVSKLFQDYYAGDDTGARELEMNRSFGRLGSGMSDPRMQIQNFANAGMLDMLSEAGVVDPKTGEIDLDRAYKYYYGDEYNPQAQGPGGNANKMSSKGGKAGKRRGARPTGQRQSIQQTAPGTKEFGEGNRELIEVIRSVGEGQTQASMSMAETLMRIEERLAVGLTTYISEGEAPQMAPGGQSGKGWNRSLKSLAASGLRRGWGAAKGLGRAGNAMVSGGVMGSWAMGKGAVGMAAGILTKGFDKGVRGIRDVYVPGRDVPALTAWKLKAGHYKDQGTGKTIKSFRDISGGVVDEEGNVVLTAAEVKTAYVKAGIVKKSIMSLGSVLALGGRIGNGLVDMVGQAHAKAFGIAKWATGKAWGLLKRPVDVFTGDDLQTPKLSAIVMKSGGYKSKTTGKVIRNSSDIDGPIVDLEGNTVLTVEQIRHGLVDRNGNKLRTGAAKLLAGMARIVGGVARAGARAGNFLVGEAFGAMGKAGGLLGKFVGPEGLVFAGGRKMVDRLTEIRNLLEERLPGKKRVTGDGDGDGIRDGSYADIMRRKKSEAESAKEGKEGKDDDKKGGLLAGLAGLLKGKKGEEEEDDDGDTNIYGGMDGDGKKRKGKKGANKPVPKGFWNKTKHYAKAGAGKAWGAAKWAGNAGLALAGLGGLGIGSMVGTAAAGVAGAAGAIGGGLLAAGGALATGAAALLASPIVLGALAMAAVGAAGYYGYKALTKTRLGQLSKVRYAQYGFAENDEEHLQVVMGLESKLKDSVVWGKSPTIDSKKIDFKKLMEDFGISEKSNRQIGRFMRWLAKRFQPVFLTNLAAAKSIGADNLGGVDSLKGADKKKFFSLAKFPEGPYDLTDSPFPDGKQLVMDGSAVTKVIAAVDAELTKEKDDAPLKGPGAVGAATVAGASLATAAANAPASGTASAGAAATGVAGAALGAAAGGAGGGLTLASTVLGANRPSSGKLDALTAVRFKTYGLQEMTSEKVRVLDMLEAFVGKDMKFNGDTASWSGKIDTVLERFSGSFGLSATYGQPAYDWKSWFNLRFMPAYLNYAMAFKNATGKVPTDAGAESTLKANAAVDVAIAVYTTPGVWKVPFSPWPGYVLNTDSRSVEENFMALKEAAKKSVLDEEKGKSTKGAGVDNGKGLNDGTNGAAKAILARGWDSVKNAASNVWEGTKKAAAAVGGAAVAAGQAIGSGVAAAGRAVGDAASAVGNSVVTAGKAVGAAAGKAVSAGVNAKAVLKAGIDAGMGIKELANFMGQQAHESANFTTMAEGLNYKSADRIIATFGKNAELKKLSREQINGLVNNPEALANVVYGKRMGNTEPGDGYKYRGRGFIQLTGKSNYAAAGKALGIDLVGNPDMAGDPNVAAKIGVWYWRTRVASKGGAEDVVAATKLIQGGDGHLAERQKKVAEWEAKIRQGEVVASANAAPEAGAPAAGAGGGRGSVNPSIPVSDQTPGPTAAPAAGTATAAASAADNGGAKVVPVSATSDAAAAGGGFQPTAGTPSKSADVRATQDYQREGLAKSMASMDTGIQQGLGIWSSQLNVLQKMLEIMSQNGAASSASSDKVAPAQRPPREMPAPPVSMSKTT